MKKSWCDQRLSEHHAGPFVLDEMLRKHYLIKAKAAWPSSKLSMASVFLFLAPLGLPVLPKVNLPAVFLPFFIAYL